MYKHACVNTDRQNVHINIDRQNMKMKRTSLVRRICQQSSYQQSSHQKENQHAAIVGKTMGSPSCAYIFLNQNDFVYFCLIQKKRGMCIN